jgi:hypothetical protein
MHPDAGGELIEAVDERLGLTLVPGDDENCVVTGNRARDAREPGAIERQGQ